VIAMIKMLAWHNNALADVFNLKLIYALMRKRKKRVHFKLDF
jgi:hypothetical protein